MQSETSLSGASIIKDEPSAISASSAKNSLLNRSRKNLRREVGRAIADYNMIEDGDLVMVCQKQPDFPEHVLPRYLDDLGVDYTVIEKDTYSIVTDKVEEGKTYCGLCSRLRRGILYNHAQSIGATKIALGHHRDDIVETLFLNMFYGGKLKAMPPKLLSDDKRNIVIRPLAYCKEKEISRYAELSDFPIIPCNLCGTQDNMQRQAIKAMLQQWDKSHPGRVESIFRSIANVSLSQLADTKNFPFADLRTFSPDRSTECS